MHVLEVKDVMWCPDVGSLGRPSSGTRASTDKKRGKGKQAAAAAAAQELEALQARWGHAPHAPLLLSQLRLKSRDHYSDCCLTGFVLITTCRE